MTFFAITRAPSGSPLYSTVPLEYWNYALQHFYGGGFAGAVKPSKPNICACSGQINAINGDNAGIMFDEISGGDDLSHNFVEPL